MEEKRKKIDDILIIQQGNYLLEFINLRNRAGFAITTSGFQYYDPFGNTLISHPTAISINKKVYSLKKMRDEIKTPDGIAVVLPENEIQDIAHKTFYEEGQFHVVDFFDFTITEKK